MPTIVRLIALFKEPAIKAILENLRFRFTSAPHAFWGAHNKRATITFYKTGKLLIQSGLTGTLSEILLNPRKGAAKELTYDRIGTSQSGTGDYFGPLAFAAVLVTKTIEPELIQMGIRRTKQLTSSGLQTLIAQIKFWCPYTITTIRPTKYNRVYERFRNLNRILGWGHARVIEDLLVKSPCPHIISHQAVEEKYISDAWANYQIMRPGVG